MGKRAERGKARTKQQAGPWLYRVMAPGERIVAGVSAVDGPPVLALRIPLLVLTLAAFTYATYRLVQAVHGELSHGLDGPFPLGLLWVPLLLVNFLNRPVFLAVTGQRVICYRLSFYDRQPLRLLFAVPLAEVRVTRYRQGRWLASLRCEAPEDGKVRRRRLTVARVWQPDLDALLAALNRAEPAALS